MHSDFPDNIIETGCNSPLEGNPWSIQTIISTNNNNIASYSPILVGDIDGNGVTDIIVAKYNGDNYRSCEMNIYSGNDLSLQHTFTIPDTIYLLNGPYAIGRYPTVDGNIQGAIFVHCYDKKLRAYAIDGTLLNTSDRSTQCDGMVSLADFNGDGYPEVYSGSDIFDAATLKWLCSGPSDGNKGLCHRGPPAFSQGAYHHTYFAMSLAYDVLGDNTQELICGNTIYNVNIASRTDPSLNSVTVNKTITPPIGFSPDGNVSLADLDLDGECEVLVIRDDTDDQTVDTTFFYAYKPSNGQILFQHGHLCFSTSYVFVGNIDSEPHPEIVFLENQPNYYYEEIICWRYTLQSGLTTLWTQGHDDTSGMTSMTLFDFNHDNIMELVFRDNNNLRIINASGKSHITGNDTIRPYGIYAHPIAAGTGTEYPVVADVNGDGTAEIVVTGLLNQHSSSGYNVGYGGLHVFSSPNWAPARPVWNQYMYHVTNVNQDLTIPTSCFNISTAFASLDGTIQRPFNNFLQQATYLTQNGEPYNPGASIKTEFTIDACNSYTWNDSVYSESGDYQQFFTDENGCDSIVTLHLTINIGPNVGEIQGQQDFFYDEYGTFTYSIDSVPGAFGYEWSINNDWNVSFSSTSPQCTLGIHSKGQGTLIVHIYSECGLIERKLLINHDHEPGIKIYPNPNYGKFNIQLYGLEGTTILQVYDYLGQLIDRFEVQSVLNGMTIPYSLSGKAAGVYLISITNGYDHYYKKVVKDYAGSYGMIHY